MKKSVKNHLSVSRVPFLLLFPFLSISCSTTFMQERYTAAVKQIDSVRTATQPRFAADKERVDTTAYRNRPPENTALKVPGEILEQLKNNPAMGVYPLAEHLTSGYEDPFLQVKAIHDWVALNISYDAASFLAGSIPDQDFISVLRRRKAVCEGYSQLFDELARVADIRSSRVSGYARGYGSSVFDEELPDESNHAWNAVLINGVWYLLDATWDSGYLDGRVFRKAYSTGYLFLEPERMIYTHFPEVASHQLLPEAVTPMQFSQLPFYGGRFFEAGLAPFDGIVRLNTVADRTEISFDAPEDMRFSAQIIDSNGAEREHRTLITRSGNTVTLYATFPEPGLWSLSIFTRTGTGKEYSSVAEIGFSASAGTKELFPLFYSAYTDHEIELVSPLLGPLERGSVQRFSLRLPGYYEAYLSDGSRRYLLEKSSDGDLFSAEMEVPRVSELTVYGKRKKTTRNYEGIVKFFVE